MGRLLAQLKRSSEWRECTCARRRLCSGSLAGASPGGCGAVLLRPATAGGVATGYGALKVSPPDTGAGAGAEEGRGVVVRMSSGSFSDHGRSGVVTVGVGGCARAGGEAKGSRCVVVLRRWASGPVDGVAPVKMDVGSCLDMEKARLLRSRSQHALTTLSVPVPRHPRRPGPMSRRCLLKIHDSGQPRACLGGLTDGALD